MARLVAIGLAGTYVVYALAFGAGWPAAMAQAAAHVHWALHAPRVSLLATAPLAVRIHVTTIVVAFVVGLVLLAKVKGSSLHRALGWTWVAAMTTTAISSLFIHEVNRNGFSFLHLFTGWTLIALPVGLYAIRTHRVRLHARMMTGLFTGGLVLAGAFAFVPGRLMWRVFFG